ncbi:uncharacterized protein LOC116339724 [Contarinia nasturtii]|uniref:uncharacterized protein LOC116339724 n=1 Tax=Contarinia nasturtii TaxID=265458 RepID=UPI0012D4BFC9|nr:uncharacterized protein LOC116339724 [Contarinia nasturtii]
MGLTHKIAIIIYVLVFIFAKLFYCIDVNHTTVTMTPSVLNESTNSTNTTETNSFNNQTTKLDSSTIQPQLEHGDAMQICNETNPTPKESLIELNLTGTLSDEIDLISTCFIRCYLDKMGILKTDILDRERAMDLELARNEDILDDCSKESRDEKDMCMRAYFFLRCVVIWNLIYDDAK